MDKVKTIISKEWAEVFKNRWVTFSIIFMPLLFTAMPLIILYMLNPSSGSAVEDLNSGIPAAYASICDEELSSLECLQVYIVNQFLLLFLVMPLILPVNIAAYSVVGEKTNHSLEPLLATPISTVELLIGKNLAAVIPAITASWAGFGLFIIGIRLLLHDPDVILGEVLNPLWLSAILIAGPLMAVLSVNFAMMVSSRVNDPRVAEQLSSIIILPLLLLFFGQIAGYMFLNNRLILYLVLVLLVIDAIVVYLGVRLFERENILTRWK